MIFLSRSSACFDLGFKIWLSTTLIESLAGTFAANKPIKIQNGLPVTTFRQDDVTLQRMKTEPRDNVI